MQKKESAPRVRVCLRDTVVCAIFRVSTGENEMPRAASRRTQCGGARWGGMMYRCKCVCVCVRDDVCSACVRATSRTRRVDCFGECARESSARIWVSRE